MASPKGKAAVSEQASLAGAHNTHHYGTSGDEPRRRSISLSDRLAHAKCIHHIVEPDDTLTALAVTYNVPVDDILKHNKLYVTDSIHTKKVLLIPASSAQRATAKAVKGAKGEGEAAEAAPAPSASTRKQRNAQPATKESQTQSALDFLSQFDASFSQVKAKTEAFMSSPSSAATNFHAPRVPVRNPLFTPRPDSDSDEDQCDAGPDTHDLYFASGFLDSSASSYKPRGTSSTPSKHATQSGESAFGNDTFTQHGHIPAKQVSISANITLDHDTSPLRQHSVLVDLSGDTGPTDMDKLESSLFQL
eukprot:m.50659 g.50659  ORF g.50659 m.50659 type:complete len:305 (-) comp11169_c0_seq2:1435-2349(-)